MRRDAASALGILKDTSAVAPLVTALEDVDSTVRVAVAQSLGVIGDARAVDALIAVLSDTDSLTACAACEALGGISGANVVEPLIRTLGLNDEDLRECVVRSLASMGTTAVEPLIIALRDSRSHHGVDSWARWRVGEGAVRALGEIGDERAIEPIIAVLGDIRASAAQALDRIGWHAKDDADGARYWIAKHDWERCRQMGSAARDPLETAAMRASDETTRVGCVETLAKLGPEAAAALRRLAHGRSGTVRRAALAGLAEIGEPAVASAGDEKARGAALNTPRVNVVYRETKPNVGSMRRIVVEQALHLLQNRLEMLKQNRTFQPLASMIVEFMSGLDDSCSSAAVGVAYRVCSAEDDERFTNWAFTELFDRELKLLDTWDSTYRGETSLVGFRHDFR